MTRMTVFREVTAAVAISVKSIGQRLSMSLATIVGIALVVLVLVGFLSMANGFRESLSGTGSADVMIVTSRGAKTETDSVITADQFRLVEMAPGLFRDHTGKPIISGEAYAVVSAKRRGSGDPINLSLRGVGASGLEVRSGFTLPEGRMFTSGSQEIVIGRSLNRQVNGFDLGRTIRLGPSTWTIVGIFDAKGSALESEIWGDISVVRSFYKLGNTYQSIRIKQPSARERDFFAHYVRGDPQLRLAAISEQQFFSAQSRGLSSMIEYLGWPLAMLMALGALAGALNTMHSSVAARASEIGTLRILGFGAISTFSGVMAEAAVLALVGATLGILISVVLFNGMSATTISGGMTMLNFKLALSVEIVLWALTLGLSVGLLGGAIAAWRAVRQPILEALSQ